MKLKHVVIFANPIAGRGRGRTIAKRLAGRLAQDGLRAEVILEKADDVKAEAIASADAAIVIGGDGTLRTVARRFHAEVGVVPPLLPVPMGTANLMGRHLGIRWDDRKLADHVSASIARGQVMHLDAARANGEMFLLMAGIGIDAHIVHELDRMRTGPITYASYVMPTAMAFSAYRYSPVHVTVDGQTVLDRSPAMVFVGNVAEYGTGFPLLPMAKPDDGLLDVCVVPCRSRIQLIEIFLHAAAGEHLQVEGVQYFKGKRVRVEADHPLPMQVDGEAAGHTPVEVDLLPVRVPFIVPVEG